MIQRLLYLIVLLLATTVHGQQEYYVLTYNCHHNLDRPAITKDVLTLSPDQKKTYYHKGPYKFTQDLVLPEVPGKLIVIQDKSSANTDEFVYFDFQIATVHSRVIPWAKPYLLKEPIPVMKWQLHEDTKITDNQTLHKATTTFRGRNYTLWYSSDYPITVGPWKFNNLPGLAFEITEDADNYSWYITDIKQKKLNGLPLRFDLKRGVISIEDFPKMYRNEIKTLQSKSFSRMPKDLEIISEEINYDDYFKKNIEISYE